MAATATGIWYPGARLGHTARVRPSAGGTRYEAFVNQHIRQSKGRWRGRAIEYYPQQKGFHHELFRTEAGKRIHKEAMYGIPRKNGKSTDAAALALYLLLADDEPAPEVYGAAGSREQARAVFTEAQRMVRASAVLSDWCRVQRNEIIVPSLDGVFRVVSADGGLQMGSNPSGVVCDELHVWKGAAGRELYYALSTGMDARENPLLVSITTAGYDKDSIAYDVFERGVNGEAGLLMYWLGALEGEKITDPDVWLRANPAPWIDIERLERAYRRLPPAVFARLHLNLWTESEQLWLPPHAWNACRRDEQIAEGERVWLGVDIGLRRDSSAVVEVALRSGPNGERRYIVKAYIFEPAEQGGVLDMAPVEKLITELSRTRTVVECRYDPQFFQRSAEDLSETVRMVEVPMSNARVVPMSQHLYEAIIDEEIEHDGDPEFARHVTGAAVRETERGWRVSKAKSKRQIDALIALMLAMSGTSEAPTAEPGARPIDLTPKSKGTSSRAEAGRIDGLVRRARRAVEQGGTVECTAAEYREVVRGALQAYAATLAEDGDGLRASLALGEVARLDGKFK